MTETRMAIAYAWHLPPWELADAPLSELAAMARHLDRLAARS